VQFTSFPPVPYRILPVIVFSQFAGTSLWFAGNAVLPNLQIELGVTPQILGHITSAVQLGFIVGTLLFAVLSLADRFSPRNLFLICSLLGAIANLAIIFLPLNVTTLLLFRFITGLFLAGIYPVGMKIAADWHERGLGKALGYLVGALVLGTAFPHLLKALTPAFPWTYILYGTSGIAALGGLLLWILVPDGPYRKKNKAPHFKAAFGIFKIKAFRQAAVGYFGHMWELYTFWAFVPVMLASYPNWPDRESTSVPAVSYYAFWIIAPGSLACIAGGYLSQRFGSKSIATWALALSFACGLVSPWMFGLSFPTFVIFLLFWGLVVIADSPQFSTLVSQTVPKELTGTGLTVVNCLGFTLTVISLQVLTGLKAHISEPYLYLFLALGPTVGLVTLLRK